MDEIRRLLQSQSPVRWLFLGDSITHGAFFTFGGRDYTQLFAERVRFELARSADVVINTAIAGSTTRDLLDGFGWRVEQFRPEVVLIMIGMNDCIEQTVSPEEFAKNLNTLADRSLNIGSRVILQTTCPILPGSSAGIEPFLHQYMDLVRQVAAQRGLPLVDHEQYWVERTDARFSWMNKGTHDRSIPYESELRADRHFYWMGNGTHPNVYGHRVFATLLFQELGIYNPESYVCRLYVP